MHCQKQRFGFDVQCLALVVNFNNIFSIGYLYRAGGMYVIAVDNEMRNDKIITE